MHQRNTSRLRATLRSLIPAGALSIGILAGSSAVYAEPTVAQLEQQISEKSHELELVVEQYNKINEQLQATRAEIDRLRQALPHLEQRASQARSRVTGIAQTAYQTGGVNGFSALLAGGDGKAMLQRLGTLQQLAQSQQQQIAEAQQATATHVAAGEALEEQEAAESARFKILQNQRSGIESELAKLDELKQRARGTTTTTGTAYTGPIPQIAGSAGIAVSYAYQAIGKPYVWAADGPDGYDCSGLTKAAWRAAGVSLSHHAATQWNQTVHIGRSDLAPGDLVFYSGLGHVAIYIGDGKVIHAPTFGDFVKISNVDMMPPYGYGRVRA